MGSDAPSYLHFLEAWRILLLLCVNTNIFAHKHERQIGTLAAAHGYGTKTKCIN